MKLKVFSIYDSKAGFYMEPFYSSSKLAALRSFSDLANKSDSFIAKHPEDYTLFELGEFDCDTGRFDLLPTNVSLGIAHEFVKPVHNNV